MIKIYDSSLNKYITVSSNRGDKLYTKSINFESPELPNYDNDSSIITIDEALTSLSEEIKKNKEGIAWVYKNGTIGGGSGSGGSGIPKFKVTTVDGIIENDNIIVNNNQTLNLSFNITGTSNGRKMNISIKDDKGNFYGYNNSSYTVSSKATTIQIKNIQENMYIEFTGYDQETLSIIESYTLNIKVSELKISGPESVEVSKSKNEYNISYNIITTYGQATYLKLSTKVNNVDYFYTSEVFTNSKMLSVDIFSIFSGLELENLLKNSLINNMDIKAEVISGNYNTSILTSVIFTSETEISVDITPITSVIEGLDPEYEYTENDNINFTIKLYFSNKEFYVYYKLYQIINDVENVVYSRGDINNPTSNLNKISSTEFYSKSNSITIPYPAEINPLYPVFLYVKAWDKNDQLYTGERTKWFGIRSDENWSPYNLSLSGLDYDIDGGLNYLYYEYNSKNLNNVEITDKWISSRKYKGSNNSESDITGYIKYYNANNITNGIILSGKSDDKVNKLRMSSNSYGVLYDNNDKPFMPFNSSSENWMNNSEGWTISLLFKSDIQPNPDNVIFSCASFTNSGELYEGIYITTEEINVKFTNSTKQINKWNLSAKLTQNTLNQVDIVYSPKLINDKKVGELRVYVNGVLAAGGIETNINFYDNDYYPTIKSNMTIGASHNSNKSMYFNYSDVNFYRILFYKKALTPYHITKNRIQGKADVEVLENGNIDKIANNLLRDKNFFTKDGRCLLIDKDTYATTCSYVKNLYTILAESGENPLPVMLIKVNDSEFKNVVNNRYNEAQVAADKKLDNPIITKEYSSVVTIVKEKSTKPFIVGSQNSNSIIKDFSGKDCTVKLQGTSTLGNKSKNFELSFGASNSQDHLVQIFDDMLPENSWIAKADVMDSGHANNAAIGGFINDFLSTYSTTANQQTNNNYRTEIKATTEGHPVIMFMQFGDTGTPEFLGIYSLNLGRISYYNLGYQVFDGYYKVKSDINSEEKDVIYENHKVKDTTIEFPAYVSTYKSIPVPYTNNLAGIDSGSTTAVCYECNGNNNIVGSFQQSNADVINEFYYRVYPEIDNTNSENAFNRFRKLFIATSNLYECDPEYLCKMEEGDEYLKTRSLLLRNSKGEFLNTETNQYETFNKNNINLYKLQESWTPADFYEALTTPQTNTNDNFIGLNWDFASAYFVLAMVFGLTDSLGKNLNIRSFNLSDWYISFYDMDTGLGLTNSGNETVKKDVYLDTFELNQNKREIDVKINGYNEGGYDTRNSRLFNIIRFFTNKAYPNTGSKPSINYRKIWENIRKSILKNPEDFINNYYIKQNENVGEILFNYDYDVKYINDELDLIEKPTDNGTTSINFLHGNRVNFVRDWFTKHVYFLDGVFDIKCNAPLTNDSTELYGNAAGSGYYGINSTGNITTDSNFTSETENVKCPYISFSVQNDRVNPSFDGYKPFKLRANMPMFFIYNNGTINQRLYIPENKEVDVELYFKSGNEQTMSFNYFPYLITFDKFGTLSYTTMTNPNLASITKLDLSNTKTLSGASFDISRLIELRTLNMNNTKITGDKKLTVNLQNAKKISYIDLRNSDVESLTLPGYGDNPGGSLEEIYIDNTSITNIDLTGHAMLKTFSALNCDELEEIIFKYNNKLTSIGLLPSGLKKFTIDECNSLESLDLTNMERLSNESFNIGHLESLKSFKYSFNRNVNIDDSAYLTELDLSGCPNLEELSLVGFSGSYIILNNSAKNTLKSVNISNSFIDHIIWYDNSDKDNIVKYVAEINNSIDGILDFKECKLLEDINVNNNKRVKYILLSEESNYIEKLNINYCDSLIRVTGNINIDVDKFKGLQYFRFNELCKYDENDETSNIILLDNGDVKLTDNSITFNGDYDENDSSLYHIKYDLNKLLTHYNFNNSDGKTLESAFAGTGINISDLYAILKKLESWKSISYINEETNPDGYISEFKNTFANCKNIKTGLELIKNPSEYQIENENIKFDIFEKYNNLLNLIATFSGCSNINGYLTDNADDIYTNHESIFTSTLTNISNIFNGCGELKINSYIFNKSINLITIIEPFSDNTKHILNNWNNSIKPSILLNKLEKLEKIINLFSNTKVNIQFINEDINLLFANNENLKVINRILPNDFPSSLDLYGIHTINLHDIFGGYTKYQIDNGIITDQKKIDEFNSRKYPKRIEDLSYAFATDGSDKDQQLSLNWNNMDYIFYNLDIENIGSEDEPKYANTTLKSCAYMFDKLSYVKSNDKDGYFDYTYQYAGNDYGVLAKFPINMFNIKFKDENGIFNEVIFKSLNNFEGLFKRSAFYDELKFPGNIFKYCTAPNLNLSHLLEDSVMTPIKLVTINDKDENGNNYSCFSICKLNNVSSMFKNCFKCVDYETVQKETNNDPSDSNYYGNSIHAKYDRGGLHGIIPYNFFYNIGPGISNMESVFEGCKHLGVSYNVSTGEFLQISKDNLYYINRPDISTLIDVSNGIINDYSVLLDLVEKDKDDNYIWNTWSYDGTTFDDEYLNALQNIKINNETYLDAKHNAINDYILIKYNGDVLVNSSTDDKDLIDPSTNEIIKKRLNEVTINNIIDELSLFETNPNMANSLLNDKCYIKHDSKFTTIDVDNYIKIYIDSDYDIKNVNFEDYTDDGFIRLWNCNSMTYLNNEEPQLKYQHENVNNEDNKSSKLFVNNYIVPMDIFRYCSNNCNINYAFKNIASFNNNYKSLKYNDHIYGMIGRIPPRLFEKLTEIENIKGVFDDYKKLNPYSQSLTGEFDSNIFKYNTKLKDISDLFSNCMLLGNLHIDIFAYNKELRNISNIFKNSYMSPEYGVYTDNKNDYVNFVDNKIFRNNINLNNLSGAFSRDMRSDNIQNGYLYFDIDNSLLTPKNNQYLNNVSSLFAYQKGIQRDSSKIDEWIDFSKGWSFINGNYTNCYLDANFNRNKIPTTMGGNMSV